MDSSKGVYTSYYSCISQKKKAFHINVLFAVSANFLQPSMWYILMMQSHNLRWLLLLERLKYHNSRMKNYSVLLSYIAKQSLTVAEVCFFLSPLKLSFFLFELSSIRVVDCPKTPHIFAVFQEMQPFSWSSSFCNKLLSQVVKKPILEPGYSWNLQLMLDITVYRMLSLAHVHSHIFTAVVIVLGMANKTYLDYNNSKWWNQHKKNS